MGCRKFVVVLACLSAFIFISTVVYAAMSQEEKSFLRMYFTDEELQVISTTRSLKSITRVAENVEVLTKEDIEMMNAHTLADVLNTVNGVVVGFDGASPGSVGNASIQGSELEHVTLFLDGVALNLIVSDQADVAAIPVQMIDKVEVIKGPASSVWGSSLGGIINVITKSTPKKEGVNGTVSASYGKKDTGDFRAEVTGRRKDLGFYFYAGRLQTDGLRPKEEITFNDLYAKFTYDATSRTKIGLTLFYDHGDREMGDTSPTDIYTNKREDMFATLSLDSSLTEGLDLSLSLRAARQRFTLDDEMSDGTVDSLFSSDDRKYGASARLTWKSGMHNIVVGSDYDYQKELSPIYLGAVPSLNVFAVYANDTVSINKFSITPGIRYDHTDRDANFTSPSVGITYEIADKTLFRADVARGFHLPNLGATVADQLFFVHNPDLKPEKVWSYQVGLESSVLKYAWLKLAAFRHDISDAIITVPADPVNPDNGITTVINAEKVRRQGLEAELKTMQLYHFTFSAGAMYVHSKDLITGETVHSWPDYSCDVSLKYDDEKSFRALLRGRYVWEQITGAVNPKSDFIFDVNLIKTVLKKENRSCEIYLTGHNIFNGFQYWYDGYKNASRWVEAGIRYKF
jgi:vitamin B12 transporter